MAQQPVELILVRHLASCLAVPVFVVDARGDLVYFNEPAERVLGRRYDEVSVMTFDEWTTAFAPSLEGQAMAPDQIPLAVALRRGVPDHGRVDIVGDDDVERSIEVTAFPIIGADQHLIGAVAMFWESART